MRPMTALLLAAPLLFGVACKKKAEPEPAATEAPAPAPPVVWKLGPATFTGSRAEGNMGTLAVPVAVTNNSGTGLVLEALRVGILGADGSEACNKKVSLTDKTDTGGTISTSIELECPYTKLPSEGKLSAKVTAIYALGGESEEVTMDEKVGFTR